MNYFYKYKSKYVKVFNDTETTIYSIVKELEEGSSNKIFICNLTKYYKNNQLLGTDKTKKVMRISIPDDDTDINDTIDELKLHQNLYNYCKSNNIPGVIEPKDIAISTDKKSVLCVLDYYEHDVLDYLNLLIEKGIDIKPKLINLILKVNDILVSLRPIHFTHGDLKYNNILCNFDGDMNINEVILIDFGLSHCCIDNIEYTTDLNKHFVCNYNANTDISFFILHTFKESGNDVLNNILSEIIDELYTKPTKEQVFTITRRFRKYPIHKMVKNFISNKKLYYVAKENQKKFVDVKQNIKRNFQELLEHLNKTSEK